MQTLASIQDNQFLLAHSSCIIHLALIPDQIGYLNVEGTRFLIKQKTSQPNATFPHSELLLWLLRMISMMAGLSK